MPSGVVLLTATDHLLALDRLAHRHDLVAEPGGSLESSASLASVVLWSRSSTGPVSPSRNSSSSPTSQPYSSSSTASTQGAAHFSMPA